MKHSITTIKIAACIVMMGLVFAGRMVMLYLRVKAPLLFAVQWSMYYGVFGVAITYFLVDLIFARGVLQVKIRILMWVILLVIASAVARIFIPHEFLMNSRMIFIIAFIGVVFIICCVIGIDAFYSKKRNFTYDDMLMVPRRYQRFSPVNWLWNMFCRLFPNPVSIGLHKIGSPGKDAVVVVTGNYDLTVRRVIRHLKAQSIDCYVLICDSRGVNIWCSTLADHFNTDKIISALILSEAVKVLDTKRLILPQLCAANVSLDEIKKATGFRCRFGPVHIKDLTRYLEVPEDRTIRQVTFNAKERMEITAGAIIIPVFLTVIVFNFIGLHMLMIILPVFYLCSYISALIFPFRFIKNVPVWSLLAGVVVFGLGYGFSRMVLGAPYWIYTVSIAVLVMYSINEFEGWSPLVKFSFSSAYTKPVASIDTPRCSGCGMCMRVCPKGVYEMDGGHAVIVNLSACNSCKSCVMQCPTGALEHSAADIDERMML